jgi:hypothetical protein
LLRDAVAGVGNCGADLGEINLRRVEANDRVLGGEQHLCGRTNPKDGEGLVDAA